MFLVEVICMWQLPKGRDFLPRVSIQRLQKLYDLETNGKVKIRLLCAIHRKRGESIDEIAYLLSKRSWQTDSSSFRHLPKS